MRQPCDDGTEWGNDLGVTYKFYQNDLEHEVTSQTYFTNEDDLIVVATFDKEVTKFFTDDDLERGYIEVANRKGVIEQFPLTAISIGVVIGEKGRFSNILEIGEIGAQVKHMAKSVMGSSYAIDRRQL